MSRLHVLLTFRLVNAIFVTWLAMYFCLSKSNAQESLPNGFVFLRNIDPTITQDIRYATSDNFVGRPLPGYDAPECVLRSDAALALHDVQVDLEKLGLAIKVYDCYRPARAVRAMAQWSRDGFSSDRTKRFFPRQKKNHLFALGYLAATSRHPTGYAVDLTLIERSSPPAPKFNSDATYGLCNEPAEKRAPDNSLDMGTGYDCLDVNSHTVSSFITAEQRGRRKLLVDVMKKYGFKNYFREWWHFEYLSGITTQQYDFPIQSSSTKIGK